MVEQPNNDYYEYDHHLANDDHDHIDFAYDNDYPHHNLDHINFIYDNVDTSNDDYRPSDYHFEYCSTFDHSDHSLNFQYTWLDDRGRRDT